MNCYKYLSLLNIDDLKIKYKKNAVKYYNIEFINIIINLFVYHRYKIDFYDDIYEDIFLFDEELDLEDKKHAFISIVYSSTTFFYIKQIIIKSKLLIHNDNDNDNYDINNEYMEIIGNILANKYLKLNIKEIYGDLYSLEYNKIYNILQELKKYIFILESNKIITKKFISYYNSKDYNRFVKNTNKEFEEYFKECKNVVINTLKELFIDIENLLNDKLRFTWVHLVVSINSK